MLSTLLAAEHFPRLIQQGRYGAGMGRTIAVGMVVGDPRTIDRLDLIERGAACHSQERVEINR